MNRRHLFRLAPALAGMLLLGGCPPPPKNVLVNESGQEIRIENWDKSIWSAFSREFAVEPGGRYDGMSANAATDRIWIGDCSYQYPDLNWDLVGAIPVDSRVRATRMVEFRLQPDFTIRVYPLAADGTVLDEFTAATLPARPQIDCRTKG
jgi:hypothetical protein